MRKKALVISILVALTIFGLTSYAIMRHNEMEVARMTEHRRLLGMKFSYARVVMRFEPFGSLHERTEVVFVHTEEEAVGFPDHVKVMWPGRLTRGALVEINDIIRRDEVDVSEFGLTYPITIENVVDDWEKVFELYDVGFNNNQKSWVTGMAAHHARDLDDEEQNDE